MKVGDIMSNMIKNNAFTLAEVLVTLGIIGVVSAMTVPTLMQNYQRQVYVTSLHKVYNEFTQAFERYMSEQRVTTLRESDLSGSTAGLNAFVKNYFKIGKDCGTQMKDCFAESYTFINNAKVIKVTGTCNKVFDMTSGAAVCLDVLNGNGATDADGNQTGSATNLKGAVATIEVDVNGPKGPNIYGRDYFVMYVNNNGELKDYKFDADGFSTSDTSGGSATGAFGQIMEDGWQMKY